MATYVDGKLENFLTPDQMDEQLKRMRETLEERAPSAAARSALVVKTSCRTAAIALRTSIDPSPRWVLGWPKAKAAVYFDQPKCNDLQEDEVFAGTAGQETPR